VGAEALLRWRRPDGAVVYPDDFIPAAESAGFVTEITIRMLEPLVDDMVRIRALGQPLVMSFNASARDFDDDRFVNALLRMLDDGRLASGEIQVEVTESAALCGSRALLDRLGRLRDRGIGVVMDDFGAGYATIESLAYLPFSSVKLDNGTVRRMRASDKDANIVESSIRLVHRLGLDVIAEGVETEATYRHLQNAGCSQAQGFWIGRPSPLDTFLALAGSGMRWPEGVLGLVHMAILDHLEWRKCLIDTLLQLHQARLPPSEDDVRHCEIDAADCRLGRWYDGPGRELAGLPAFAALGTVHGALHACASRIVELMRAGTPFDRIEPALRELSDHSVGVIASLQALELAVLDRNHAQAPHRHP
jgi:EAL domain-containing protein (putative c-di-GMP-specific phosphodiesterase class I)